MDDPRLLRVRHDLANPLSAILAETQLLLMRIEQLPPDVNESLIAIESAALRMRAMLRDLGSE
jgi:signal transduction histidine kinase